MRSRFIIGLLFCAALTACQKPAEEGGSTGGGGGEGTRTGEATTDCGVVTNGKLSNPVNLEDGKTVKVTQIISNNLVIVQDTDGGTEMVKLQGVSSSNSNSGRQLIQGLTSPDATYFKATKDCNVPLDGGGTGSIGQLISRNGQSVTEALIKRGFAQHDANDACNGNLIGACLGALRDTPNNPDPGPVESVGEMEQFLWKPLSDTKGPIAVVLERHCNTTIRVNGQSLSNGGGSNGRCNTSHGTKAGCGYGKNIRVEVIDNASGKPYTRNGQPFVIVPDGCSRFSF